MWIKRPCDLEPDIQATSNMLPTASDNAIRNSALKKHTRDK